MKITGKIKTLKIDSFFIIYNDYLILNVIYYSIKFKEK